MGKPASPANDPLETTRRRFLKLGSGILGTLISITLGIPLVGAPVGSALPPGQRSGDFLWEGNYG